MRGLHALALSRSTVVLGGQEPEIWQPEMKAVSWGLSASLLDKYWQRPAFGIHVNALTSLAFKFNQLCPILGVQWHFDVVYNGSGAPLEYGRRARAVQNNVLPKN